MKKENNKKIGLGIAGVVVLVAVFYGGMVYGKSQVPVRGQGNQAFGAANFAGGARGGRNIGGGFTVGQIISKDATSITVQAINGAPGTAGQGTGSKIVFLDSNTKITKSVDGTAADLATGTQVSVTGTPNSDGSINAQTVQIRPNVPPGAKVQ
jgi:hypothetical protein